MDLIKNQCGKKINKIKKDIDKLPNKMKYVKEELQYMIQYIKKLKMQNPDSSLKDLNELLYSKVKEVIQSMSSPTRSDMYLYKTSEYILKNPNIIFEEIERADRKEYINNKKKIYKYTSDIEKNIKTITEDLLTIILEKCPIEFKEKFVKGTLNYDENIKLKETIKKYVKLFYEGYSKEMKKRYSLKLANTVKLLDEMGFLKIYNDRNNRKLEELNLPMLEYEYEAEKNKFAITDLKNPEFVKRFSLDEIIAMTSFYDNRLTKEVMNFNEGLYIANKIGMTKEIFEKGEYELNVTDEGLREIIAQLGFLTEIANEITKESAHKSYVYCNEDKVEPKLSDNKTRKKAIEEYKKDYNELYKNFFLTQFYNDFEMDLDIATILEIDRYNLYSAKDFAMESLMVILADKKKSNNINWGYIPENNNGKNSIQNKDKFVLIGMDMKGYNMPIKLHFEKEKLETFLINYTKSTELPVYEGNEDMQIPWKGFMTTQVYMPLTKDQRKQLKETELPKLDYRYHFLEHIKWMMFPNRYPDYLCDHQGNKKKKRYVDVKSGKIFSPDEPYEL